MNIYNIMHCAHEKRKELYKEKQELQRNCREETKEIFGTHNQEKLLSKFNTHRTHQRQTSKQKKAINNLLDNFVEMKWRNKYYYTQNNDGS